MMVNCPVCGKLTCIHWPDYWVYRRGQTYYCSDQCMDVAVVRDYRILREVTHKRRKVLVMASVPLEKKKKAIEIALKGGDVLGYLAKIGSRTPKTSWGQIKRYLKESDPITYAKILAVETEKEANDALVAAEKAQESAEAKELFQDAFDDPDEPQEDLVPTVKVDGPLKIETTKPEKVEVLNMKAPEEPAGDHKMFIADEVTAFKTEPVITVPLMYDNFAVTAVKGLFGEYRRIVTGAGDYIDFESEQGDTVLSLTVKQWPGFIKELRAAAQVLGVHLDV